MSDVTAYQGVPGAFSEAAARAMLGHDAAVLSCRTLDDVFAALERGDAQSAVVPIENTLAGAVPGCVDLLARADIRIVAERVQPIVHAWIGVPGATPSSIRRVCSHPVALAQCANFFKAHPQYVAVPTFDTAGAVADIMREGDVSVSAIASSRAAEIHGAVVLADAIQDSAENFTRFLHVERGAARTDWRAGHKTTVNCRLANEPGALVNALMPIAAHGLNMLRIESRPRKESPFEYEFVIDIAPVSPARVASLTSAMAALHAATRACRVLGHYPVAS